MRRAIILCVLFLILPMSWAAGAEQGGKNNSVPMLLQESTIKNMIDIVSRQVARRYDLRPDQSKVAHEMLEKNTLDFVNKHYDAFIQVVPAMQEMRMRVMNGNEPSAQEVQTLARKLLPIYQEATELIVRENEKFATVLDEKQKTKHQKDMDRMQKDVGQTMDKLNRWKDGKYEPGEFMNRGPRKPVSRKPAPEPEKMSPTSFDFWELYVKTFIDAFQLDQMQVTMAYSVLNDMKTQAQAYRNDHRNEFTETEQNLKRLASATQPSPQRDADLKKWQEKQDQLDQPLFDLFDQLKVKLMDIPNDNQRKKAQEILGGDAGQAAESKAGNAEKK